jgi:hypothetical protein
VRFREQNLKDWVRTQKLGGEACRDGQGSVKCGRAGGVHMSAAGDGGAPGIGRGSLVVGRVRGGKGPDGVSRGLCLGARGSATLPTQGTCLAVGRMGPAN